MGHVLMYMYRVVESGACPGGTTIVHILSERSVFWRNQCCVHVELWKVGHVLEELRSSRPARTVSMQWVVS